MFHPLLRLVFFGMCTGVGCCLAGCATGIPIGQATGIPTGQVQVLQWRGAWSRGLSADAVRKNNAIRLSLWRAAETATGTVKAKKTVSTREGDPVVDYLVVSDGAIESVRDYRKDPLGPPGIVRDRVDRLHIGCFDSEKRFREGTDAPEGAELLIRFALPGRWDSYF